MHATCAYFFSVEMISDMERIGDQASDIAEITSFISGSEVQSRIHIRDMALAAINMVTESIDSFVKQDMNLAEHVIQSDDVVDGLFVKVKAELIALIKKDNGGAETYMDLLMIAKYLERIGDHATNVAEWVLFSITGKHVES